MSPVLRIFVIAMLLASWPAAAQDLACDRDCLKSMVDSYLAAMAEHDPESSISDDLTSRYIFSHHNMRL